MEEEFLGQNAKALEQDMAYLKSSKEDSLGRVEQWKGRIKIYETRE